jgi:hypothetical protein
MLIKLQVNNYLNVHSATTSVFLRGSKRETLDHFSYSDKQIEHKPKRISVWKLGHFLLGLKDRSVSSCKDT